MKRLIIALAAVAIATPVMAQDRPVMLGGSPALDQMMIDTEQLVDDLNKALVSSLRVQASCKKVYDEQEQARNTTLSGLDLSRKRDLVIDFCRARFPSAFPTVGAIVVTPERSKIPTGPVKEPLLEDIEFCYEIGGAMWDKQDLARAITQYEDFGGTQHDPSEVIDHLSKVKMYLAGEQLKIKPEYDNCVKEGIISDDESEEAPPTVASNPPN